MEQIRIPYQVPTLDAVPQPLRLFFVERDGTFHLNLEGDHPDSVKLEEFRTNNRSLHTQKTELESTVERLTNELNEVKSKATADDEQARKVAELHALLESEQHAHRQTQLKAVVTAAFVGMGGEGRAADYLVALAAREFSVGATGELTTTSVNEDGSPVDLHSWLREQAATNSWLFKPSRGGGAENAGGSSGPAKPTISRHDIAAFGANLEAIAKGNAVLTD